MKLLFILLTLTALSASTVSAQGNLCFKNKKSGRLKRIKTTTNFEVDIKSSAQSEKHRYFGRITQLTDTTLAIEKYLRPSHRGRIAPTLDTIKIQDIKSIKNYLIDNEGYSTIGGVFIAGGLIGLLVSARVWQYEGTEEAQDVAIVSAGLFGTGVLLILPQLIAKRRDMTEWEFVKG
jgi:hypothetical protein